MATTTSRFEISPIMSAEEWGNHVAIDMTEGYLAALKTETDPKVLAEIVAAATTVAANATNPRARACSTMHESGQGQRTERKGSPVSSDLPRRQ